MADGCTKMGKMRKTKVGVGVELTDIDVDDFLYFTFIFAYRPYVEDNLRLSFPGISKVY